MGRCHAHHHRSTQGPLLFTIFTPDLPETVKCCLVQQHANDTQLYRSCLPHNINAAIKEVNCDLNRVSDWSSRNTLVLNPGKICGDMCGIKSASRKGPEPD